MKPQSGKAKGRRLQIWVAQKVSDLTGIPILKDGDIESRPMGQSGPDIIVRGKAKEMFDFVVECKNREIWRVQQYIKHAKEHGGGRRRWLLFIKKNRQRPVAVLDAERFFEVLNENLRLMRELEKLRHDM